ncbi:MAG TPA: hypothetical protein PK264_12160 [Hyphomicrobiaceae bacterium]|nr:hypothetical protein [Hyphomicrobiaceae bacterium]
MSSNLATRMAEAVPEAWKRWRKARALKAELLALPAGERARVLQENGLSEFDLERIDVNHEGPQELLPRRLEAIGLDKVTIAAAEPAVARDLERVCSRCGQPGRCAFDLEQEDAAERLARYCPNTGTIDALKLEKSR